jgi:hypothetical protein
MVVLLRADATRCIGKRGTAGVFTALDTDHHRIVFEFEYRRAPFAVSAFVCVAPRCDGESAHIGFRSVLCGFQGARDSTL